MRRMAYAGAVLAGLVTISFALAILLIDGESVREAIGARLEATLGQPVELGEVELSLFPLPAARIRDARIGDPAAPALEARAVRVSVSLVALLAGKVVLRSIELEGPRLRVPLGDAAAAPAPSGSRWSQGSADDVELAITKLVVSDGTLERGSERLEKIELSGGLDASLGASFDFAAQIPELGRIEDGELSIDGLGGPMEQWHWTATAELAELDMVGLRQRLNMAGLWGKAQGKLDVEGTGPRTERASLELESQDLDVRSALLRLWGPTRLKAAYPDGSLEIDLTDAQLAVADVVEKPSGTVFRISAKQIDLSESGLRLSELDITSDALRAAGKLEFGGPDAGLELSATSLDLSALSSWSGPPWMPRKGTLSIDRFKLAGSPPALSADGALSNVRVELPGGKEATLSGAVLANGTTIGADSLSIAVAGEVISTSFRYDWLASTIQIAITTEGTRVAPVLETFANFKDVSGRLYARMEVSGPLDLYKLKGSGEFELVDAEWRYLSLATAMFREPPEELLGRTDPIQRLRGRFEVQEDEIKMLDVSLEQDYAQARVTGSIYLKDLTADGTGELSVFTPDMDQPVVLQITKVGGPLNALSMNVSNGETEELRQAEASMIEAFRKAEQEERDKRRGKGVDQEPSGD